MGLQFVHDPRNLIRILRTDVIERNSCCKSLCLDLRRQTENHRSDALHEWIDQREVLASVEQWFWQRRRDLLAQKRIKCRRWNLESDFEPRRECNPHESFGTRVEFLREECKIVLAAVLDELA